MAFVHHKWNKSGRTWVDDADSNKFAFTTQVGDTDNVALGGGNYAPFVWNGATLRHGASRSVFSAQGQAHSRAGAALSSTKFFVTKLNNGGQYVTVPHGLPVQSFDDLDHKGEVHLDFNTPSYALRVTQIATSGSSGEYRFTFTPKVAGDYIIEWVESGVTPGAQFDSVGITSQGRLGQKVVGVSFADIEYRWDYYEADQRAYVVTTTGAKRKLTISLGAFSLAANETLVISPDTFGAATIGINTRDGQEGNDTEWLVNGHDTDGSRVGNVDSDVFDMGFSWDTVTVASGSTVTSCTVELYMKWGNGENSIVTTLAGFDEDDTAVFASGTRPSTRTKTTASVAGSYDYATDFTANTYLALGDASAIVQEIIDRAGWVSGNALGMVLLDNASGADVRWQFQDYNNDATNTAKITIVYTPAGGAVTTRTLSDSVDANEPNLLREAFLKRDSASTITVTDTASSELLLLRRLLDSADITDAAISSKLIAKILSEAIVISDSTERELLLLRRALDSVDINDDIISSIIAAAVIVNKTLSDSVVVSDGAERELLLVRNLLDTADVNDAAIAGTIVSKILSEALVISDSLERTLLLLRALVDNADINDAIVSSVISTDIITRVLAEAIAVTDSSQRDLILLRNLFDAIEANDFAVSEVVTSEIIITRALLSSLDVTDNLSRKLTLFRALLTSFDIEDFSVSEIVTATSVISKVLSETIDICDWRDIDPFFTGVVRDTFQTKKLVDLKFHVGEVGAVWTRHGNSGSNVIGINVADQACRTDNSAGAVSCYYPSSAPPRSTYTIEFDVNVISASAGSEDFVAWAKLDTASLSGYALRLYNSADGIVYSTWELVEYVNGSQSTLIASYQDTIAHLDSRNIKFVLGDNTQDVYIDDVLRMQGTETDVRSIGEVGVGAQFYSQVTVNLDNFEVYDHGVINKQLSSSISVNDSLLISILLLRNLLDTIDANDSITASIISDIITTKKLLDSLNVSDFALRNTRYLRDLIETIDANDSVIASIISDLVNNKKLLDSLNVSDSSTRNTKYFRGLLDLLSATDSSIPTAQFFRELLDPLDTQDSADSRFALTRSLLETFAVNDSDTFTIERVKILVDAITAQDDWARGSHLRKVLTDSISAKDLLSVRMILLRDLLDSIDAVDSKTVGLVALIKSLAFVISRIEQVILIDTAITPLSLTKTVHDILIVTRIEPHSVAKTTQNIDIDTGVI